MNLAVKERSSASDPKGSVLISDDHTIVRYGLRVALSKSKRFSVVGEAENVADTLVKFSELDPAFLLLDLIYPDGDGIEIIRHVRGNNSPCKIVVYSMVEEESRVREAIGAGASAYVFKSAPPRKVLSALDGVQRGRIVVPDEFIYLLEELELEGRPRRRARHGMLGPLAKLSKREIEIFYQLAEGVPNREVSQKLGIGTRTVETHRARILRKLALRSNADIVKFGVKYKLVSLK